MTYKPRPLDTSKIILSPQLNELLEELSINTHEIWASNRLLEGWKPGEHRNDNKKIHPCLVPYERLSEAEKDYDRCTSIGVLKFILAKGHKILLNSDYRQKHIDNIHHEILENINANKIDEIKLLNIWHQRDGEIWRQSPHPYSLLAEAFIKLGSPLVAFDVIRECLEYWPDEHKPKYLKALSVNRMGLYDLSLELLEELADKKYFPEETFSLRGKNYKELFISAPKGKKLLYLEKSLQAYEQAFLLSQGTYSAINCATMAYLSGAKELCDERSRYVISELTKGNESLLYWDLATLAEAHLLQRKKERALDYYQQAQKINTHAFGDLSSTLKNAKLIALFNQDHVLLEKLVSIFKLPKILIFTGHRSSSSKNACLPETLVPEIQKSIREYLGKLGNFISFSSAAAGSDILFLEEAQRLGAQTRIVLPGPIAPFKQKSVAFDDSSTSDWGERFDQVLKKSHETIFLTPDEIRLRETSYDYAAEIILGLACIEAQFLGTAVESLSVFNENILNSNIRNNSGAAHAFQLWRDKKVQGHNIDPGAIAKTMNVPIGVPEEIWQTRAKENSKIMAIFFADTVNYSKLQNELYPLFEKEFWGMASKLLEEFGNPVVVKNTWGDALHLVFPDLRPAGLFALKLGEAISKTDWQKLGFPVQLSLRMALHAGPVFESSNPITNSLSYVGSNICKAARLEPMTPPGKVFASREFAALVHANDVKDFECRYVGKMAMAKNYGIFPTYLVQLKNV